MGSRRIVECTKSTLGQALMQTTRYSQTWIAPGLNLWVYESKASTVTPVKRSAGCGLEVGVVLEGELFDDTHWGGKRNRPRGTAFGSTTGERYVFWDSQHRQVGFMLFGPLLAALEGPDRELRFAGLGVRDRRFVEFCRSFAERVELGLPPAPEVKDEVCAFVSRHFILSKTSPIIAAKKELERYFDRDLGMDHVCAGMGLRTETFCRQFKRDYGVTPAHYRIMFRLNHATRLLWMQPDWSLEKISEECGFASKAYFHRAYLQQYSMTPGQARQRFHGSHGTLGSPDAGQHGLYRR
jgi:AraC-like DNA-binding protein